MISSARKTRIATVLIGAAVASALAPAASVGQASDTTDAPIYVNPSTGYPSSLPMPDDEIKINPSTGIASGGKDHAKHGATAGRAAAESQPALEEPQSPSGFDWPSAAIGAAAGTALLLMLLAATIGVGRRDDGPLLRRRAART